MRLLISRPVWSEGWTVAEGKVKEPLQAARGPVRQLAAQHPLQLFALALGSFLVGLGEALVLFLLVSAAAAIAGGGRGIELELGPWTGPLLSPPRAAVVAVVVILVSVALVAANSFLIARMSTRRLSEARKRILGLFLNAAWSAQAVEPPGRLQEALTSYVMRLSLSTVAVGTIVSAGLGCAAMVIAALLIQLQATAVAVVAGGLLFVGLRPARRITKRASQRHLKVTRQYAERVSESVALAQEIDTFGVGDIVSASANQRADDAERSGFTTRFLLSFTPALYNNGALLLIVAAVVLLNSQDGIDAEAAGAVVVLLLRSLSRAQRLLTGVQQLTESAPYLAELSRLERTYATAATTRSGRPIAGVFHLELADVAFSYDGGAQVLKRVSFRVSRGEAIGLVGPSGAGKSTLVQLLLRLRPPTTGTYLVNGQSADVFASSDWYRAFAFVPQDNQLFYGSIADNIRFFRDASDQEVARAAERAHLDQEIGRLPLRYNTVVGGSETQLSGGQRQRLGLARALLAEPDVLILDEPTSALDMRSEALVQQTLRELAGDVVVFIVAHRISTLSLCDRLLVLEDGRISGNGPAAELQVTNSFFRDAVKLSRLPA